jgi:hypothetical protein
MTTRTALMWPLAAGDSALPLLAWPAGDACATPRCSRCACAQMMFTCGRRRSCSCHCVRQHILLFVIMALSLTHCCRRARALQE